MYMVRSLFRLSALAVSAAVMAFVPLISHAQTPSCTFTQTLQMGVISPEVRCLQEYLNATGYQLTAAGPGSPGNETDKFGNLTQAAVIAWQEANDVSPAIGIFGPKSQATYNALASDGGGDQSATGLQRVADDLMQQVAELQAQRDAQQGSDGTGSAPSPQVAGAATSAAEEELETRNALRPLFLRAIEMIEDAEDAIDAMHARGENNPGPARDLADAHHELFLAIEEYFEGHFDDARGLVDEAYEQADDAFDDAGGEGLEEEADDTIDQVDDQLDDAWDEFEEAEDDDLEVGEAEDYLEEAEDLLDQARALYDDEEYDEAIEKAEDAEDLIDDALDEIGNVSEDEVEDAIDDAWDEFDDAEDEIDDAKDDGDAVDEAEEYLEDAENDLEEAEDHLDDGEYEDAVEAVEDALDAIDDALDEL